MAQISSDRFDKCNVKLDDDIDDRFSGVVSVMGLKGSMMGLMIVEATKRGNFRFDFDWRHTSEQVCRWFRHRCLRMRLRGIWEFVREVCQRCRKWTVKGLALYVN